MNQKCRYGSSRRKRREEYESKVKNKVAEAEWKYLGVNEHLQQMKNIMMETAQVTCGLSKDTCRHKETLKINLHKGIHSCYLVHCSTACAQNTW